MRILVLNHEFPPVGGGASPMSRQLCRALAGLGHGVDVVTMRYGDLPVEEERDGVRIHRTWAVRRRAELCHTHEMATYLVGAWGTAGRLAAGADVVHCHFLVPAGPLGWLAARKGRAPWVVTCHGSDVPGYNPERFGWDHKVLGPAWRFLARRADVLVSPSESLAGLIRKNCATANVRVIPNGIDLPEYVRIGGQGAEGGIAGRMPAAREKRVLMVSRLLGRKGFQYALEAMRGLGDEWQVDVVGEGPYREELERVAKEARVKAKFWGWLDREEGTLRRLYETAGIFVFPSEAENFPTVLLEAMAAGTAIITSTAGGCPEVVGEAGVLVRPRDSGAIRAALVELMGSEEKRAALGAAARQRVERFGWKHVAREYAECFSEAIAARRQSE